MTEEEKPKRVVKKMLNNPFEKKEEEEVKPRPRPVFKPKVKTQQQLDFEASIAA